MKESDPSFVKREYIREVKFDNEFYVKSNSGPWVLSDFNEKYETDLLRNPNIIGDIIHLIKIIIIGIIVSSWILFAFIGIYTILRI